MRPIDADLLLAVARDMQAEKEETAYNFLNAAQNPSTEWGCVEYMIENAPTIEPEVRHGRWIDKGEYAVCTECDGRSGTQYDGVEPIPLMTQFCPHCGARMDGKDGGQDAAY